MPTFLIFKNRAEVARVQGADVRGLTSAVEKYAAEAKSAAATFASSGKGYTLGASSASAAARPAVPRYVRGGQMLDNLPVGAAMRRFLNALVVLIGLYLVSLLSLDAIPAAESSSFNIANRGEKKNVRSASGTPGGVAPAAGGPQGRRLGTLDSIRGSGG